MAHISIDQSILPGSAEFPPRQDKNRTDPEEQVDPIQEDKVVGSCRRITTTYILEACSLDFAIQDSPFKYRRSGHACERL